MEFRSINNRMKHAKPEERFELCLVGQDVGVCRDDGSASRFVGRVDMEGIAPVGGANDPDNFLMVLRAHEVVPRPDQLAPRGVKISPLCVGGRSRRRDMPRPGPRVVREVDKRYTSIALERADLWC